MSSLDTVNASLFFSAAVQASKEAVKSEKKDKTTNTKQKSFAAMVQRKQELEELASSGLPQELAGLCYEEAIIFLKDAVDIAGDQLLAKMDTESFSNFRKSVGQFLKYISKNNYEVPKIKRLGFTKKRLNPFFAETRPRDPLIQVKIVDKKLDELASVLLKNHADKLCMLEKVGEIKGLLIDFFAS